MSELSDIIGNVVTERGQWTTTAVLNVSTGATFYSEIEGNLDPFTIPEAFGRDPRAKFRLHVTDYNQASGISTNDIVSFTLFGRATKAKIVDRDLDPAAPQTKFLAIHLVDGKDQT